MVPVFEEAISMLVDGDRILAKVALDEALTLDPPSGRFRERLFNRFLEIADEKWAKAETYHAEGRYALEVKCYKDVWLTSNIAIRIARQYINTAYNPL